jgi:hypothetical protein
VHARWLPAGTVGAVGIGRLRCGIACNYSVLVVLLDHSTGMLEGVYRPPARKKNCIKYKSYEIDGCPVHITIKLIELNVLVDSNVSSAPPLRLQGELTHEVRQPVARSTMPRLSAKKVVEASNRKPAKEHFDCFHISTA